VVFPTLNRNFLDEAIEQPVEVGVRVDVDAFERAQPLVAEDQSLDPAGG
jgi:hypothetical protein